MKVEAWKRKGKREKESEQLLTTHLQVIYACFQTSV